MFKSIVLALIAIISLSGYWFYNKINSPQLNSNIGEAKRVTNLPWQITIVNPETTDVIGLKVGKDTLKQAVKILKSEYNLAWFEKEQKNTESEATPISPNISPNISLEAYFFRVNLSGLRAKIILELDTENLDMDYLRKNSGKPEILVSHSIKYPLDDLAQAMSNRVIKSLTYVPKSSVDAQMLKRRFGQPGEVLVINKNSEFWLYPAKGLVITHNKKGKEAFQYIPIANFERLRKSVMKATSKKAKP